MNKQEVYNLIANNSIRMTNRQWLESLSDEELAEEIDAQSDYCFIDGKEDEVNRTWACDCGRCHRCILAWLRAEHKEDK